MDLGEETRVEGRDVPIGEGKAVGGKNRAVVVDEDRLDTEQLRDFACVLAACTSEACQADI